MLHLLGGGFGGHHRKHRGPEPEALAGWVDREHTNV